MNDTSFAPEKGAFFGFTEMCWHGGRLTGRIVAMALLAMAASAMIPADVARAQTIVLSGSSNPIRATPEGALMTTGGVHTSDPNIGVTTSALSITLTDIVVPAGAGRMPVLITATSNVAGYNSGQIQRIGDIGLRQATTNPFGNIDNTVTAGEPAVFLMYIEVSVSTDLDAVINLDLLTPAESSGDNITFGMVPIDNLSAGLRRFVGLGVGEYYLTSGNASVSGGSLAVVPTGSAVVEVNSFGSALDTPGVMDSASNTLTVSPTGTDAYRVIVPPTGDGSDASVTVTATPASNNDGAAVRFCGTGVSFTTATGTGEVSTTVSGIGPMESPTVTIYVTAETVTTAPADCAAAATAAGDTDTDITTAAGNVTAHTLVLSTEGVNIITPSANLAVTEGEMATYMVGLNTAPTGTVTVTVVSSNAAVAVVSGAMLELDSTNWEAGLPVEVRGVPDDNGTVETVMLTHTPSGGNDYAGGTAATLTVDLTEANTRGLSFSVSTVTVVEDGNATYMVELDTEPTAEVEVVITSDNADVTVNPTSLTFPVDEWDMPKTVRVSAAEDPDGVVDTAMLTHNPANGDYNDATVVPNALLTVNVTENDTPRVIITPTTVSVTEGTGGEDTYAVSLGTDPTADVTVTIMSDTTGVSVDNGTLTFTSSATTGTWRTPQIVTVEAAEGNVYSGTATLTHTAASTDLAYNGNGIVIPDVMVRLTDNDPSSVTVTPATAEISESDAESVTLTVSLNRPVTTGSVILPFSIAIAEALDAPGSEADGDDFTVDYPAVGCGSCDVPSSGSDLIEGTLTFATGVSEQTKTFTIAAVMDEIEDEGDQVITFTLTTPSEPVAQAIVDADESTLSAAITIREMATEAVVVKNEVETVTTLIGAEQVGSISGLIRARFTSPASVVASAPSTPDTATALHLPGNPQGLGDILNGLGLEHTADADGGGVYAVWARGTYTSMEGDPMVNGMKVDYDGDSTGLGVGVEKVTGRYIAGVAMNWLTTDLDLKSEDNEGLSKYEESLLMVAPYLALRRDNGRSFWISAGYGTGDADGTTAEDAITASADVSVTFLNTGADFVLTTHENGELIGSLSALAVRKTVDSFNFAGTDPITATTLNTFRGQGEVTYYRSVEIGDGRIVKPYVGLATLHDAGDKLNDDSHALDLRGGGEFQGEKINASLEVSTELLRKDHKSWSISGSARYLFSPEGLGASLTLDGSHAADSDMGLEGGYGMPMRQVHRDALLTPFAGMRHGSGSGEFSSGMRLAIGSDMDADLRAARRFSDDEDTLKLNFRRTF